MTHNASVPEWDLADRLRKIRRDRHMTQEEFAHELGVKPVTFSAWEAGRSKPHDVTEIALQIERLYGVPAAWTLGVMATAFDRRRQETPGQRQWRRWTDMLANGGTLGQATA